MIIHSLSYVHIRLTYSMITIAELFPLHSTCYKWLRTFREITNAEKMRLEKEYIIHTTIQSYERIGQSMEVFQEIVKDEYMIDGKISRTDGPAEIMYYKSGGMEWQGWYIDGKRHRTNGPANIGYFKNGKVEWQSWYVNNTLHRTDGPACIGYFGNGKVEWQSWYVNGERHRLDNPARIRYHENGDVLSQEWWVNGERKI